MRNIALLSALMLTNTVFAGAQEQQQPTPQPEQIDTKAVDKAHENTNAIYGKIKTVTTGQKIVIDVDKGRDKTYNLADPKIVVRVAEGLAVGDPVKVLDAKVKGNRTVDIVRNVEADTEQRSRTVDSHQPPAQHTQQPAHDTQQPAHDPQQPNHATQQPGQSTQQPAQDTKQPAQDTKQPEKRQEKQP